MHECSGILWGGISRRWIKPSAVRLAIIIVGLFIFSPPQSLAKSPPTIVCENGYKNQRLYILAKNKVYFVTQLAKEQMKEKSYQLLSEFSGEDYCSITGGNTNCYSLNYGKNGYYNFGHDLTDKPSCSLNDKDCHQYAYRISKLNDTKYGVSRLRSFRYKAGDAREKTEFYRDHAATSDGTIWDILPKSHKANRTYVLQTMQILNTNWKIGKKQYSFSTQVRSCDRNKCSAWRLKDFASGPEFKFCMRVK